MTPNHLKQMYGSTPQSFQNRITYTLANADGQKLRTRRPVLRAALMTALVLFLGLGTCLALFHSQVADYFGWFYGEDPETPGGPFPRPSFAAEIGSVAFEQLIDALYHYAEPPAIEKTERSGITLAQAEAAVENVLSKLRLEGYERSFALDMSVERIREWGAAWVEEHKTFYNVYDRYYDFTAATESDEGYYLIYTQTLNGLPVGIPDSIENVQAFVNANGIVTFQLRNSYEIGEVYSIPDKLLSEDEIRDLFEKDNDRRIANHFYEPTFVKATLKYAPMRAAEKKDGMVMAPAWYIEYTFVDGSSTEDGWAWYSALDGKLIMDCYS